MYILHHDSRSSLGSARLGFEPAVAYAGRAAQPGERAPHGCGDGGLGEVRGRVRARVRVRVTEAAVKPQAKAAGIDMQSLTSVPKAIHVKASITCGLYHVWPPPWPHLGLAALGQVVLRAAVVRLQARLRRAPCDHPGANRGSGTSGVH